MTDNETDSSPTSTMTLMTLPPLVATKIAFLGQLGSAVTARILDPSRTGLPFLFLDFRDLRSDSARESLRSATISMTLERNCGTASFVPATYVVWKKWSGSFDVDIVVATDNCNPSNRRQLSSELPGRLRRQPGDPPSNDRLWASTGNPLRVDAFDRRDPKGS